MTRTSWRNVPIEQRLWGRSIWTESGCLEFQGTKVGTSGYGNVYFEGRYQNAHRIAWQLTHGPIPEGLVVMHACDNPPCINPDHLSVGTIADNNADRARKGRNPPPPTDNKYQSSKTHCPRDHPYDGEHLGLRPGGHRYCRTCARTRQMARQRTKGVQPRLTTHCGQGHEFTPENTRHKKTRGYVQRVCRTCARKAAK